MNYKERCNICARLATLTVVYAVKETGREIYGHRCNEHVSKLINDLISGKLCNEYAFVTMTESKYFVYPVKNLNLKNSRTP